LYDAESNYQITLFKNKTSMEVTVAFSLIFSFLVFKITLKSRILGEK